MLNAAQPGHNRTDARASEQSRPSYCHQLHTCQIWVHMKWQEYFNPTCKKNEKIKQQNNNNKKTRKHKDGMKSTHDITSDRFHVDVKGLLGNECEYDIVMINLLRYIYVSIYLKRLH